MLTDRFNRFVKTDEENKTETERIISLLKDSPELEERARKRDLARLERLQELLARRAAVERDRDETMPRLRAAVEAAQDREKRAHEALQVATRARVTAEDTRLSASLDANAKLSNLEAAIRRLAPREIDDFIWEMRKALDEARRETRVEIRPGPKARFTGVISHEIISSNCKAVDQKCAYIQNAIADAEAMKRQPIAHEDITRRLDQLRIAIPKVTGSTETERFFPDVAELRQY